MGGVSRGGKAFEPEHLGADDVHVLLRNRRELAPERVERVPVQTTRASFQAAGVDEVRSADLRDVHLQARLLADENAGRACVVEVDVREQEMAEVGQRDAQLGESLLQRRDARGGPAVVEPEAVLGLEQVHADHALLALVVKVHRIRRRHAPDPMQ